MAKTDRPERVAYHEAGHAVAAWRTRLNYKYVTIKPDSDGGSLGHLMHGKAPKWFRPDLESNDRICLRAEREIVTCFAGQLAEKVFLGKNPRGGMHSDNQQAVDMAFHLCGSGETATAYLRFCFLSSKNLVHVNWKNIQAVAGALVERQTLSFEDVIEAMMPGSRSLRESLKRNTEPTCNRIGADA